MYEQFYGFSAKPFQLTPDPKFHFESADQRKAMACLEHGLSQQSGIMVLTGAAGMGKSALVAKLLSQLDQSEWSVSEVIANADDAEAIVSNVAANFGVSGNEVSKEDVLRALAQELAPKVQVGRQCLLVVDDCQSLDIAALEDLRALCQLDHEGAPLLKIMLVGRTAFRNVVAQHPDLEQLRQCIIASHNLEPMDERETGLYVQQRLNTAGWPNRPVLEDGLLEALFAETKGIPLRVNQLMNRLLLLGAIEERGELTPHMLRAVMDDLPEEPFAPITTEGGGPEENDERTAELEAAISGLHAMAASKVEASEAPDPSLTSQQLATAIQRIERLEKRLDEQEQSLRHVLTMLIEWLEETASREAA